MVKLIIILVFSYYADHSFLDFIAFLYVLGMVEEPKETITDKNPTIFHASAEPIKTQRMK